MALETYRRKRDPARTPEPVPPPGPVPAGHDDTFVIQEHHARALHWDFRLERGGVLVSWAVPKGLPLDPATNHLAVQTEDHPIDYASFEGEIPQGEYGGGRVILWDRGRYETEKWSEREVKVVLHGTRVSGRYVLFRTRGKDWMVHRMDPPPSADWAPLPELVRPMLASPAPGVPPEDGRWAYEFKWDGVRALVYVEGGRARVLSRSDRDVTGSYPELRVMAEEMGSTVAVLDGEVVAFDEAGRPSFGRLQERMHVVKAADVRRLTASVPVTYLIFDVLHLDGRSMLELPYAERRGALDGLGLTGQSWTTTPWFSAGGADVLRASRDAGLEGVVAKRLDSSYTPGRRSECWLKIKNVRTQAVVVGGWKPGTGRRSRTFGSLLLGVPGPHGLDYAGHVGTGFSDTALVTLQERLDALASSEPPFAAAVPREHARDAHWVRPELVGEVAYTEWTREGRLRHPAWRGLREMSAAEVQREE